MLGVRSKLSCKILKANFIVVKVLSFCGEFPN